MPSFLGRDPGKSRTLWGRIVDLALTDVRVVAGGLDEDALDLLEERLLSADFGVAVTMRLLERARGEMRRGRIRDRETLIRLLRDEVTAILAGAGTRGLASAAESPTVYLMIGVNGVGKTTSVAKLAHHLKNSGQRVLVAAADTYRAGAVAQLEAWATRIGVDFVRGQEGGDPASVAFDALAAAEARGIDTVLVDTAGRLHTHGGLMQELGKIDRVVTRRLGAPAHERLLVLDATVGQNALQQVRAFSDVVELTGIVLAKADSSSRGGVVVALALEQELPVKLIGTGEGIEDLMDFDPEAFADAVFAP